MTTLSEKVQVFVAPTQTGGRWAVWQLTDDRKIEVLYTFASKRRARIFMSQLGKAVVNAGGRSTPWSKS